MNFYKRLFENIGCPPKVVVCALTFVWLGFNRFCGFATAKVVVRL